jgi:hypothetical protein
MKHLSFFLACIVIVIFTSCGNGNNSGKNSKKDSSQNDAGTIKKPPVVDAQFDDLGRLLAGFTPSQFYKNIADTGFYRKYQSSINSEWERLDKNMIQPILIWQKDNINQTLKGNKTCFYPYSGADFLYANLFFSDADNYILIGLEPPGSVTDPTTMTNTELSNYLYSNDNAMTISHDKGFYRTLSMEVDFTKKHLNGTVHNILFYVVRRGYKVTGIDYFSLDTTTSSPKYTKAVYGQKNDEYGVKVKFTDDKGSDKAIYYLSYNLRDSNMVRRPELLKFVDSFGGHYTFLKAASYLPHYERYSIIRNYMLKSSTVVLQDDSGIPYNSFNNGEWEIHLLGDFKTVLTVFRDYFQPGLKEAYAKLPEKKILPFQIGYNVSFGVTNLQYCIKKNL